ncbi:MAG: ABC transporter ATP-binding protein, partial [Lachnospiraceae bacterium]|nr:ABC transporter ATP-binding protein [Lachnospiraceae bacterium]
MPGPIGPRGARGPKPKLENPGKLFKRIIGFVLKDYAPHVIIVVICIFVGVFANVQGTLFMQTLIDRYIVPLLGTPNPNFSGLAHAIARVACFYAIGAFSAYLYNRIMINVSQGTMRNIRNAMFGNMETLPIKYFDTHAHGDIMSCYTNDIDTLRQMISQSLPQCLNSAITIVTVLISMFSLSVPLTFTTLVM